MEHMAVIMLQLELVTLSIMLHPAIWKLHWSTGKVHAQALQSLQVCPQALHLSMDRPVCPDE